MPQDHRHKFDPGHLARLDDPERVALLPPGPLIQACPLGAAQTLCDIGCGSGYWTFAYLASAPADARFFCVDSEPRMLRAVEDRLEGHPARPRVRTVLSTEERIPLPDAVVDVAVLGHVYHELANRRAMLAEVRRILRQEGRVAVLDWQVLGDREQPLRGPPNHERVAREVALAEMEEAGFRGLTTLDDYPQQWCVVGFR